MTGCTLKSYFSPVGVTNSHSFTNQEIEPALSTRVKSQNVETENIIESTHELFIYTAGAHFDDIQLTCTKTADVNGDSYEDIVMDTYTGNYISHNVVRGTAHKNAEEVKARKDTLNEKTWYFLDYMVEASCDIHFGDTGLSFGPIVVKPETGGSVHCVFTNETSEVICECQRDECENDGQFFIATKELQTKNGY